MTTERTSSIATKPVTGKISTVFQERGGLHGLIHGEQAAQELGWLDRNGASVFVVVPDDPSAKACHILSFLADAAKPELGSRVKAETITKDSKDIVLAYEPVI